MSGIPYVGATPTADSNVMPKSYADSLIASLEPTNAWVTNQLNAAIAAANLVTQAYIDTSNARLAQIAAVNAADATYAPSTALNAANGVAGLDGAGNLLTSQLPAGVPTEFTAKTYDIANNGIVLLNGSAQVQTDNLRELPIAAITVDDPGYPYRPIPFAICAGGATTVTQPFSRTQGTNVYGLLSVMPQAGVSDQVYGAGVLGDSFFLNYYNLWPYAAAQQTPSSVPACQGTLDLYLYGCCWTGSGYTFTGQGLQYWILAMPSM